MDEGFWLCYNNETSCQEFRGKAASQKREKAWRPPTAPKNAFSLVEIRTTTSKWHLDRFIRFCSARGRVQHIHKHTDDTTPVAVGRVFALCACDVAIVCTNLFTAGEDLVPEPAHQVEEAEPRPRHQQPASASPAPAAAAADWRLSRRGRRVQRSTSAQLSRLRR